MSDEAKPKQWAEMINLDFTPKPKQLICAADLFETIKIDPYMPSGCFAFIENGNIEYHDGGHIIRASIKELVGVKNE